MSDVNLSVSRPHDYTLWEKGALVLDEQAHIHTTARSQAADRTRARYP